MSVAEFMTMAEAIANTLRQHQVTRGMRVASGVTCRCGYWTGNEKAGKTRPVGFSGLTWHQAVEIDRALAVHDAEARQAVLGEVAEWHEEKERIHWIKARETPDGTNSRQRLDLIESHCVRVCLSPANLLD